MSKDNLFSSINILKDVFLKTILKENPTVLKRI